MNFILRFFNKKSIRIAELEKAAESHAREIGGHKASYTKLKRTCVRLNNKLRFILNNNTGIIEQDDTCGPVTTVVHTET